MSQEKANDIAVIFKDVSKTYKLYENDRQRLKAVFFKHIKPGYKKVLNGVNLEINRGETVAFFGRNGAGKSTLLKLMTGVIYPTKGKIHINGKVSALLELTAGFDLEFTGRENIYFRGQLLGMKNNEIAALEDEIVSFAELGDYIDQPVRTYSSGMKARLGFAINVNIKPEILIVDEALSVGDKAFRIKCRQKINEIVEKGATFLFVTHSISEAKKFCQRGVVMRNGTIIFDGNINDAADYYGIILQQELDKKRKRKKVELYDRVKSSETYENDINGQVIKRANFRNGPGKDFGLILQLKENEIISIKGHVILDDNNLWYRIEYKGAEGYVYSRLIKKLINE